LPVVVGVGPGQPRRLCLVVVVLAVSLLEQFNSRQALTLSSSVVVVLVRPHRQMVRLQQRLV